MLIQQLKRLFQWYKKPQILPNKQDLALLNTLEDPYATITIQVREDGDFAVAMGFTRMNDEAVDVSATMLHMINSGIMIEYFIEALKLWGEDEERARFAAKIIKEWKSIYDDDNPAADTATQHRLAIDPSDVFGLKHLKAQ